MESLSLKFVPRDQKLINFFLFISDTRGCNNDTGTKKVMIEVQPDIYKRTTKRNPSKIKKENNDVSCPYNLSTLYQRP